MKNVSTKNIADILENSGLAAIVQRSNEINLLNEQIQLLLPKEYQGLYRVSSLTEHLLAFEVQNATVRQGLLMQQSHLLSLIQRHFPQVSQLSFRIMPHF